MDRKNNIFNNVAFIFDSNPTNVMVDVKNRAIGYQEYKLKVAINEDTKIRFAYQYGEGLIRIDNHINSKRKSNILGEFIKIKFEDLQGYIDFVKEHGFLFPIETNELFAIDPNCLVQVSKRINATLDLLNMVNGDYDKHTYEDDRYHYKKMFELAMYILIGNEWCISSGKRNYKSLEYDLQKLILDGPYDSIGERVSEQEEINNRRFTIKDAISGDYQLDSTFYRNIINGYDMSNDAYKAIVYLFANKDFDDKSLNRIVDTIFHYYHDVGVLTEIDYDSAEYEDNPRWSNISDELEDGIIDFAKYVVKNEIDYGIKNIKPVYNEYLMEPNWNVDSLLSAMYFSLFYLDSKKEMWKRCAYCGGLFLVKRSSASKIYCNEYCCRNSQQAKHRIKIKNK